MIVLNVINFFIVQQFASGTCYGDSGGPIMQYNQRVQRWYLAGITSYGSRWGCRDWSTSNVMTRVSVYRDFINKYVSVYSCSCRCPQGETTTVAFTTIDSAVECVDACISVPNNNCTVYNTYACRGQSCTYHSSNNQSRTNTSIYRSQQKSMFTF